MTILITRKDYERLTEGTPLELCDGMLAKPSTSACRSW